MKSQVTMTAELERLQYQLEYFTNRQQTALFTVEITLYAELIKHVQDRIEQIVIEQIQSKSDGLIQEQILQP